jgi:hypothetical protein
MRRVFKTFFKNTKGLAALETALLMPVFLLICFGGFELWRAFLAQQRLERVVASVAEQASMSDATITEQDATNILASAALIGGNFNLQEQGRVILSAVELGPNPRVLWQRCRGQLANVTSQIGAQGARATPTNLGLSLPSSPYVSLVVEVVYDYRPWMMSRVIGRHRMTKEAALRGRLRTPTTVTAGGPVSGC